MPIPLICYFQLIGIMYIRDGADPLISPFCILVGGVLDIRSFGVQSKMEPNLKNQLKKKLKEGNSCER